MIEIQSVELILAQAAGGTNKRVQTFLANSLRYPLPYCSIAFLGPSLGGVCDCCLHINHAGFCRGGDSLKCCWSSCEADQAPTAAGARFGFFALL